MKSLNMSCDLSPGLYLQIPTENHPQPLTEMKKVKNQNKISRKLEFYMRWKFRKVIDESTFGFV